MPEPSGSSLPTAYDTAATLMGAFNDRTGFTLQSGINNAVTTIPASESLSGVEAPLYLKIGDEIVFAGAITGNSFTLCVRGARSSTAATHAAGDAMLPILTGKHLMQFREAILAGQRYQGLVGADASKPATPYVGQLYFATDTKKLYACLVAGTWKWVGARLNHADLDDLTHADAHTQYHNDARALTWHNGLTGGHVTNGDTHDHLEGGAGRVQSAASPPGSPTYEREILFATGDGYLYVGKSGVWVKVAGAAAGTVVPFLEADITNLYGGACPPGWSRYSDLNTRFPKGAASGGATGGASNHTHTYTGVKAHTHNVPAYGVTLEGAGDHWHEYDTLGGGTNSGLHVTSSRNTTYKNTAAAGSHEHTVTIPAHNTANPKRTSDDAAGVATGTTGSASHLPPYQEVIWCVKN